MTLKDIHIHSNAHASGQAARHITYRDCLQGNVHPPKTGNGSGLFQIMMTAGMILFMVTFNGFRNTGLEFLSQSHWLYPLVFCISFTLRTVCMSRFSDAVCAKLVDHRFHGARKAMLKTVVNTCCMAPIMCAITTLLVHGFDDYLFTYATTLPITMPVAMLVNYFIVGPIVKMTFFNRISPATGLKILVDLRNNVATISRIFGFN